LLIPIVIGNVTYLIYSVSTLIISLLLFRVNYIKFIIICILLFSLLLIFIPLKTPVRQYFYNGIYARNFISLNYQNIQFLHNLKNENNLDKIINLDKEVFKYYDPNYRNIIFIDNSSDVKYYLARLIHRINHISMLLYVIDKTPKEIPFWEVDIWSPVVSSVVPRLLWPSKPQVGDSHEFGHRYGFIKTNDHITTVNIDPITNSYLVGGLNAVFSNAIVLGLFFGLIFSWIKSTGNAGVKYFLAYFWCYI